MATRALARRRSAVPRAFSRAFPRRRSKAKFNISLAVVAGLLPYASGLKDGFDQDGVNGIIKRAPKAIGYDGYTKSWSFTFVKQSGILGLIPGVLAHKLANRLGVNTYVRKLTGGFVSI